MEDWISQIEMSNDLKTGLRKPPRGFYKNAGVSFFPKRDCGIAGETGEK
ncbi:MAG: hypothetical protein ACOYXB_04320 [Bacteroidota bacterium]